MGAEMGLPYHGGCAGLYSGSVDMGWRVMTQRKAIDPKKLEGEIRSLFYSVNARPANLENLMVSDGEPWREDQPYLRPERSLDFNQKR